MKDTYLMVQAMAGLDPDHAKVVEEQAIPLGQIASTTYQYLRHHTGAFLVIREISEEEYLEWIRRRYGYEGHTHGRKGRGEGGGG